MSSELSDPTSIGHGEINELDVTDYMNIIMGHCFQKIDFAHNSHIEVSDFAKKSVFVAVGQSLFFLSRDQDWLHHGLVFSAQVGMRRSHPL